MTPPELQIVADIPDGVCVFFLAVKDWFKENKGKSWEHNLSYFVSLFAREALTYPSWENLCPIYLAKICISLSNLSETLHTHSGKVPMENKPLALSDSVTKKPQKSVCHGHFLASEDCLLMCLYVCPFVFRYFCLSAFTQPICQMVNNCFPIMATDISSGDQLTSWLSE